MSSTVGIRASRKSARRAEKYGMGVRIATAVCTAAATQYSLSRKQNESHYIRCGMRTKSKVDAGRLAKMLMGDWGDGVTE